MTSLRTDAAMRFPNARRARRAAWRARLAPYFVYILAIAVVALVAVIAIQAGMLEQRPEAVEKAPDNLPADQITVSHTTITSFDTGEMPYSINADTAVQDREQPNFIRLATVTGELKRQNGSTITMKSKEGVWDSKKRTLDLEGDVEFDSAGRFNGVMDKAQIAMKEKKVSSQSPVVAKIGGGTINANGMEITNDGNNILFLNGVRAKFNTSGAKGDNSP
jgi:lipopolysaccharide export system protein LptC